MDATQRRSAFRVRLPDTGWLNATLVDDAGTEIGALVLDLSRVGMGARLPGAVEVAEGTQLVCRLVFEDADIQARATVRHQRRGGDATRLGLEFTALTPAMESLLSRMVFQLQRYLLRRRMGSSRR